MRAAKLRGAAAPVEKRLIERGDRRIVVFGHRQRVDADDADTLRDAAAAHAQQTAQQQRRGVIAAEERIRRRGLQDTVERLGSQPVEWKVTYIPRLLR